ncbi:beta-L-arabinofuranosidase domain-containing protein [Paenibacillus rhizoplanae]
MDKLGDWVYRRTASWSEEVHQRVLSVEYGGMNDCLYELYRVTGKEGHLSAAHSFDELTLFTPVHEGKDILKGKHANTTIPKFLGALNRYRTLGENEVFLSGSGGAVLGDGCPSSQLHHRREQRMGALR